MKRDCVQHKAESSQQLKTSGLKITAARLELLDIFKHAKKPLSIQEISHHLSTSSVDVATLYRNVESLQNLGLVKQINLQSRQAYYELAGGAHHHHLVCTNCGKLANIKPKETDLAQSLLKTHGFARVIDHSLEFFGVCNKCFAKR